MFFSQILLLNLGAQDLSQKMIAGEKQKCLYRMKNPMGRLGTQRESCDTNYLLFPTILG